MYILLAYGAYVLLVVIASAVLFGLCVTELIVEEALRTVPKTLARIIHRDQEVDPPDHSTTETAQQQRETA